MNIHDFADRKKAGERITMLTCYDHWSAMLLEKSPVDCLLVGDSLAMVMRGEASTVNATMEMMVLATRAVANGASSKFIVGDMPFLSNRRSLEYGVDCAARLMQAGAHAIKMEGVRGNETLIAHLVESGVPVMGHLGLTPQHVNALGGFKVQGCAEEDAVRILEDARRAEALGCFALVLECVPTALGREVAQALTIPVIGIGAGPDVDGQVLVLQDMLGVYERTAKFVRRYADLGTVIGDAVAHFDSDVRNGDYPGEAESYGK
ncbi:MAG: 3-methyl-2-oxobutanoate hydroxymethyltransferase [Gammaproteobacteria bacterium]|nr:MAG: 3-methyl-2-oxobutanoate hydroxymethyltransferase [Gammaproteobacteria bacterium]